MTDLMHSTLTAGLADMNLPLETQQVDTLCAFAPLAKLW